jgi:hypothetical protein
VRLKEEGKLKKKKITSSGLETVTFWLAVPQALHYCVSPNSIPIQGRLCLAQASRPVVFNPRVRKDILHNSKETLEF